MNLEEYLNLKPLYYDDIDFKYVNNAWKLISNYIKLPYIIHIVGTNGKGSTGRYLSSFLNQSNFSVLHYSSPHIIKFNERIWIDGHNSTDEQLEKSHKFLQDILTTTLLKKLTYFEYTTLLALVLSDGLDYIVLEAGLGGEFDATNIVQNDLTLITTIGLDHIEFLGNTIEKIATTKMKACDKNYILGYQVSNIEVNKTKNKVLNTKNEITFHKNITLPTKAINLPLYLKYNMKLALSALEFLNIKIIDFDIPNLFGRCQKYKENITIDVGHNTLASTVILRQFYDKKIKLIYNSYKDKDYNAVLMILKPIIDEVLIIDIKDDLRIAQYEDIANVCQQLKLNYSKFESINNNNEYLVFGSFKVVEEFLNYLDEI